MHEVVHTGTGEEKGEEVRRGQVKTRAGGGHPAILAGRR